MKDAQVRLEQICGHMLGKLSEEDVREGALLPPVDISTHTTMHAGSKTHAGLMETSGFNLKSYLKVHYHVFWRRNVD